MQALPRSYPPRSHARHTAAALLIAALCAGTSASVQAAGSLLNFNSAPSDQSDVLTGTLSVSSASEAPAGERFDVTLPSGAVVGATSLGDTGELALHEVDSSEAADSSTAITLDDGAGSVTLHTAGGSVVAVTVFEAASIDYFASTVGADGSVVLARQDPDLFECVEMPVAPPDAADLFIDEALPVLTVAQLQNLQSRPGAPKTLLIDYWGGTVTGTQWNASYTGGAPIVYTAYSTDATPGSFTDAEKQLMYLGWLEAVEDYLPMNVNVTTNVGVYNATAVANRSKIIATQSKSWYPGSAGGVAYVGGFGTSLYDVGWTWNLSATSMGMTNSHESGHQMGLLHDGTTALSYYSGHGVWGPIMGAPFGQQYVQWSQGSYPNANQFQNDLSILNGILGFAADDAGNTAGTATPLTLPANAYYSIRPDGAAIDEDHFSFTLPAASNVTVDVQPTLGALGETRAANLAADIRLAGVAGTIDEVLSTDVTPLNPATNKMSYTGTLAAGTYLLRVLSNSPDTNWATGFDDWGNGGGYQLKVNASPVGGGPPPAPTLVSPSGAGVSITPTFVWNATPASPATSWYYLWIENENGVLYRQWHTAAAAGCAAGVGTCSMTAGQNIGGDVKWYVQAYNAFAGGSKGPWSAVMNYTTGTNANPGVVTTKISPIGAGGGVNPDYVWNSIADSTWYQVWVQDSSGPVNTSAVWYTAASLGCPAAGGTCSTAGLATPNEIGFVGARTWYIRAWNNGGFYGRWSGGTIYSP